MWNGVIAVAFVFSITAILTPPVGALGWWIGAVDVPRDGRRMHSKPVPRCGGVAIFVSFVIGCLLFCEMERFTVRMLVGACLLVFVGLLDDVLSVNPYLKLLAQLLAALTVCGLSLRPVNLAAIFWIVLLTNAHNFIDGIDGLFAGCAGVEGVALACMLFLVGHTALVLPALLVAASCVAFRGYNRHPARIFAGDCGSATVGYLIGVLTLPLFYEMRWQAGWLAPVFLVIYPLTDLGIAVTRRVLRGRSPFSADRGHLHHRICAMGVGQTVCGRVLMLICGVFAAVGVCLCTGEALFAASLACLIAAGSLVEVCALLSDL